jgi:hypothetical protein
MPYIDVGEYRLNFVVADVRERPHVHVRKGRKTAKYWIDQIECSRRGDFRNHELTEIEGILANYQEALLAKWDEIKKGTQ